MLRRTALTAPHIFKFPFLSENVAKSADKVTNKNSIRSALTASLALASLAEALSHMSRTRAQSSFSVAVKWALRDQVHL